jgi:hypothetical protein
MASVTPKLVKTTALAKVTQLETRVNLLVASSTTELSPVVVYLEGAVSQLAVDGAVSAAGTWQCPATVSQIQVECYAAGGGGGGGTTTSGGGGGGGGEYACEPAYAVIPGNIYTYAVGRPGQGGVCGGQGGWPGGDTAFDLTNVGVSASGGGGGDSGNPNNGGTGSTNTIHFNGGAGGVSTSGIASDNPVALGTLTNVGLWWVFKGANTSNGALSSIFDDSTRGHTGTVVNKEITGLKSAVISTPSAAPPQTPGSSGNCAYFKQDPTATPSYVSAPIFGLGNGTNGGTAPWDGSNLTVSAWVKADQTTNSWGNIPSYGRYFGTILANCDYGAGFHTGGSDANSSGFALYMLNGCPGFYVNSETRSSSSAYGLTSLSTLPIDGTWHQVIGTWDGTTVKLYVDGALNISHTWGGSKIGGAGFPCIAGANPHTKTDSAFTGYMSNVWIADVAANSTYISEAFGTSPVTGGSGGGASGGSAGVGLAGTSATNTSGAAGGSAVGGVGTQLGSGAGGTGGNANVSAANAPSSVPYAGAGGGAGASSSAAAVSTLTVAAIQSASYIGFDGPDGNAGALYAISSQPQAGIPSQYASASLVSSNVYVGGSPSSPSNGTITGMALFPNLIQQLKGATINSMNLSFTVQSTNASVLPVWFLLAGAGTTELPPTFGSASDITGFGNVAPPTQLLMVPVPAGPAGRTVNFDMTSATLASYLETGYMFALVLGGFQGDPTYDIGDGAYNDADSFAWQTVLTGSGATDATTNMMVSFEYYHAGGNQVGGDGAPGGLFLSYIDPRYWPITAIEPAVATDSDGHTFAAGVTTDSIVGFDPTVTSPPRVPETWHSLGALGAGSGITIDTARYRYSPEDGGSLVVQVTFFVANGTVITGGQYNFATTLPTAVRPTCSPTASHDVQVFPMLNQNASGTLSANLFGVVIAGKNSASPGRVTLYVNFTGTASGNSQNTVIARIPLV